MTPALAARSRAAFLKSLVLFKGSHAAAQKQFCVMEAVAFVAGEPHSDHPKCASEVVSAFLRSLNDRLGDDDRQQLKPLIPQLVGSKASVAVERKRAFMAADFAVREVLPALCDWLAEKKKKPSLHEAAVRLRQQTEVTDRRSADQAAEAARGVRSEMYAAAAAAAYADAAAAAYDAAYAAAAYDAAAAAAYAAAAYDAAAAYAAYDAAAAYAADAAYAYDSKAKKEFTAIVLPLALKCVKRMLAAA